MLYAENGKRVVQVPDAQTFQRQRSSIADDVLVRVRSEFHAWIDEVDGMCGHDVCQQNWKTPPWSDVLAACGNDRDAAELFLAHVLWNEIEQTPDAWTLHLSDDERHDIRRASFTR